MANIPLTFTVVTQYPDVEFLGGTQTRDVTAVGYITDFQAVYFEARIPQTIYSAQQVEDYGTGYTGTILQVWNWAGVVGEAWGQRPTAGQQLQDFVILTVASDSGNSQSNITLPLTDLGVAAGVDAVTALHFELNAAEGVTG
jgi:hypothetical protein